MQKPLEYKQNFLIPPPKNGQYFVGQPINCFVQSGINLSDGAGQLVEQMVTASLHKLTIISDETTNIVLGNKVKHILLVKKYICNYMVLPSLLSADIQLVQQIISQAQGSELLIAVGSGTINDLVKYAATQLKIPYIVFATAPSMNGYCSGGVSLIEKGVKKSFPARPPCAAFFDLTILAAAPQKMIAAGLADCLCRSTVQTDWLFSHLLLGTTYDQGVLNPLIHLEKRLIKSIHLLKDHDQEAINDLVQLIVHSGIGMAVVGNSNPASQAEHMIAHYIDTQSNSIKLPKFLHGEIIAITTLTMASLQEKILNLAQLKSITESKFDFKEFSQILGQEKVTEYWQLFQEKQFVLNKHINYQRKLISNWPIWRFQISKNRLSYQLLLQVFEKMNLPTQPQHLNIPRSLYRQAVECARFTRNRLTFLDLAAWLGLLP